MMDELRRVRKALRILDGALEFLDETIGIIPIEVENKTLKGYSNKIREARTEFAMELEDVEKRFKPIVREKTNEEKLADEVKAGHIDVFTAADKAYNKQKFWKAMRKLAGEI